MSHARTLKYSVTPSLDLLIECNNHFKTRVRENLLFEMIDTGKINTQNRETFLNYLQIWANHFQKTMLLKTALCDDPSFMPIFRQHFDEEYGHDRLLVKDRQTSIHYQDAILEAICNWFPSKMLSFNQYEQIVVMNLCLEGAANVFYLFAYPILDPNHQLKYFEAHDEVDQSHEKMGSSLLEGLSENQYTRLLTVQKETWAMIEALFMRLGELSVGLVNPIR